MPRGFWAKPTPNPAHQPLELWSAGGDCDRERPRSRRDADPRGSRHSPTPIPENRSGACEAIYRSLCRSEEHTSELQSLMRISYAVFCLKKKKNKKTKKK